MSVTSERIKQRRTQLKISQEELADRLGTSQTQVSRYERGENDPTGNVLVKFADALDTTTDWLLGRTDIAERPIRGAGDLADSESEVIRMLRRQDAGTRERIINAIKALIPEAS